MGLDERRREKMALLLAESSDKNLTQGEIRRKYHDNEDELQRPASPRQSCAGTTQARSRQAVTPSLTRGFSQLTMTRCWCCSTALRDPGAAFFACGACGALNGVEPRSDRAFAACVLRGACRRLSKQHGRKTAAATSVLIGSVLVVGVQRLLPTLVDAGSAWSLASLWHTALTAFLASGTVFNYVVAMVAGNGEANFVVVETCPLRLHAPAAAPPPGSSDPEKGLAASGLAALVSDWGNLPMRGWRLCEVTGLSMPPRAQYCRTSLRVVKRMDHHCALLNAPVGHANHHYFLRLLVFVCASTLYISVGAACTLCGRVRAALAAERLAAAAAAAKHTHEAGAFAAATAAVTAVPSAVSTIHALPTPYSPVEGLVTLMEMLPEGTATLAALEAVALFTFFGAAALLFHHTRNLLRGHTHAEACRKPPTSDYDLGWRANVAQVFGENLAIHLLPWPRRPVGDGIRFPMRAPPHRV